jgi:hypothetical protein
MQKQSKPRFIVPIMAIFFLMSASAVRSQVVPVPPTPQIGSSNPITADPPVERPHTKPCVVQLFKNLAFANFTPKTFSYTPPSACPGPWAKVVFTADLTVSEGTQFDRTAAFYLGKANIYYGTTAEPRATLSPSWHVERDVTDLSAIFKSDQTGEANLGNFVGMSGGVNYNGIIYANAALEFYPKAGYDFAPPPPDIVVPVEGPNGDAGTLNTTSDTISQVLNLPMNVERVYLDVIAQSQIGDEFWYTCVPTNLANELESCGNTAFREVEVTIDGKPAGVAPVYPWIYTGGIDPYLWEPIPGVQTLDFKPYRVNLTPFAGLLSDGNPHTVAVSVYNANGYFLATANLLAYTDKGKQKVTGGILKNTLSAAPTPVVTNNIKSSNSANGTTYTGMVRVASDRTFDIDGYVMTSHGRVETDLHEVVHFDNQQGFDVNNVTDDQGTMQASTVDITTTTRNGYLVNTGHKHYSYPLQVGYTFSIASDGSATQNAYVNQQDLVHGSQSIFGNRYISSHLSNQVIAQDTLNFSPTGNFTSTGAKTTQTYRYHNSNGDCYSRTLNAADHVLTNYTDGQGCPGGHNDRY